VIGEVESGVDLGHMAKVYKASVHVPRAIGGQTGTINFWSTERDAFPAEALAWLEEIAAALGDGK
jgi:hypothetical protein